MVTTREITTDECPWLKSNIPEGVKVYRYYGYAYGAVSPSGVPITFVDGQTPFFEVPRESVGYESD